MDNAAFTLHCAFDGAELRAQRLGAEFLEDLWPDDDVGDVSLVLQRHEHHARGGAGPLAHEHETSDAHARAVLRLRQFIRRDRPARPELRAKQRGGMGL